MPAYVIAHLQEAAPHPEIAEYIERIPTAFRAVRRTLSRARRAARGEGGQLARARHHNGFPGIAEARA